MTSVQASAVVRAGSRAERCAAWCGLLLAVVLLRLPFRWTVKVMRLARRLGRAPVGVEGAQDLVAAVRYAGRLWPVRVACMEVSLGAALGGALLGRQLVWCVGVRFAPPPVEYHAWVEVVSGEPVGENVDGGWWHLAALSV